MVQQPSRRRNKQIHALRQLILLRLEIRSSNHNAECLRMVRHKIFGYAEDLQSQLAGRCDNDNTSACNDLFSK
jgi:hypothetical protein